MDILMCTSLKPGPRGPVASGGRPFSSGWVQLDPREVQQRAETKNGRSAQQPMVLRHGCPGFPGTRFSKDREVSP